MSSRMLKILGAVLLSGLLFSPVASAAGRSKEAGVVDYFSKYKGGSSYDQRRVEELYQIVEETGITPEWVDVDIFLAENKVKRDEYKRIVIPHTANWFTVKLFEGMDDYVKSGGLLITTSSLLILDEDESYDIKGKASLTKLPSERFLGVYGSSSCEMKKIKVQMECPLTQGLKRDTWLDLQIPMRGREARNVSAERVIDSDRIRKDKVIGEQPFLTFKHMEKGACIYLVGQIAMPWKNIKDKNMVQIIKNIFSAETLDWLCSGD
ncbi:MAG: hypothetical protein PHD91_03950 [bacterium]|jgi:hypothetical protein|nr:hypothetical protein [bacterium]